MFMQFDFISKRASHYFSVMRTLIGAEVTCLAVKIALPLPTLRCLVAGGLVLFSGYFYLLALELSNVARAEFLTHKPKYIWGAWSPTFNQRFEIGFPKFLAHSFGSGMLCVYGILGVHLIAVAQRGGG